MVKLWRDPHEKVHVKVVVMSDERLCSCATRDHVHHRRLDLQKAHVVQKSTNVRNYLCANMKFLAYFVVQYQIEVTLTESSFLQGSEKSLYIVSYIVYNCSA